MPTNKKELIDWLSEVSDDAEIGIEVGQRGQLDLIAFSGEDQYILAVGGIPEDRKNVNPQSNGQQR